MTFTVKFYLPDGSGPHTRDYSAASASEARAAARFQLGGHIRIETIKAKGEPRERV